MIKTFIVLFNLAFKCRLVNETSRVQAGTQANQLASAIDRAGNKKFYRKSRRRKFLFFSRLKKDVFFNFCACHKKSVSGKHPFSYSCGSGLIQISLTDFTSARIRKIPWLLALMWQKVTRARFCILISRIID